MCDELTEKDNARYLKQQGNLGITRRLFGKLGAAGAVSLAALPKVANAQAITEQEVMVETPDGSADAYFVHPSEGAHAAVIVWPDVLGTRPAFRLMGKRLAQEGYSVLVVNPYYRAIKGDVIEEGDTYADPDVRALVQPYRNALSPETCVTDGKAFVSFLDQQDCVDTTRMIGTTGYCMTGSYVMRLAAAIPERIGAGGSFHGGGLASKSPASPHLLAPQIKAGLLIAIAENDDQKDPDAKNVLREAFDAAGVSAEIEVYEGAMHGWCPPDSPVYNEAQAERAWSRLLALFDRELA